MSVWVSQEVMRCCLRFCRRSVWQQRSFLATASITETPFPSQQLAHLWVKGQNKTCLDRSLFGSVRFYSQGRIHSEDLEEKQHPSSTLADLSPPAEIQPDETTSSQMQSGQSFLNRLHRCNSQSDVLDLTCQYPPTDRQISKCLSHMWVITKKMSEDQRHYELQLMFQHPAFDRLLQTAMKRVLHLSNENMVHSLLVMIKLGVPQRSRVVQTFLRNCQKNLNDLDERTLSLLASCLEHMKRGSPNVHALTEGMRLVVENRLPEIKNVTALQPMMRVTGKNAPLKLKQKLEVKALSMADQFSLPNAQNMITTLATMDFYSKPLLDVCSKIIKENINGIPFSRLLNVLHACRELQYRDLDLLTSVSDYIASSMDLWNKKQLLLFLYVFESLAFCPTALMETFAQKVISDPDALAQKDLLCVLRVYSSLNYDLQHQRQQFLDSLSQALGPYLSKMSELELFKVVYYLCLLGHFPSALLEQLLQSSTLETFHSTEPKFLRNQERMFQTVHLCLRLDRPPLPQPLTVPPALLGDPVPSSPSEDSWLSQGLRSVLVDRADTVLQETVVVEDFYLIDAVITKPNQTCVTEQSSLSPAEGGQRIAVIYAPPSDFCHGTSHPCGPLATKIRHLKVLGYNPVLVTEQELQSEEERTDFLRGRIFPEHHRSEPGS